MQKVAVLVIDDSVTIRAIMEQVLLNDPEFVVAGIASGVDEARAVMRNTFHDVVTLDLSMPGTNGLEFLDELATQTHAPVIVVSSSTKIGSFEAAEAVNHGAYACFDKAQVLADSHGLLRILRKAAEVNKG